MKLLTFSDGHVGEYPEGWIDEETGLNTRLLDTLHVWDWIYQLAIEHKVDGVVFGGDRFKPHRPPSWLRDLADAKLTKFNPIPLFLLVGNHDMYDKAGKWHSYGSINVWNPANIHIFDKPSHIECSGVRLNFLPYGFQPAQLPSADHSCTHNVLFFHDAVRGISSYGNRASDTGISQEDIDREDWDLVLGGHIHLRQDLKFNNTFGAHIGTPLELIQDGFQGQKGCLLVNIDNKVDIKFIESPLPKVMNVNVPWEGDINALFFTEGESFEDKVVIMTVEHTGGVTPQLRRQIQKALKNKGVRSGQVRLRSIAKSPSVVNTKIDNRRSLQDQLIEYIGLCGAEDSHIACLKQVFTRNEH